MKRILCGFLLALGLLWPLPAEAADSKINITVIRQPDGTTLGELCCNEQVVWRIRLCADGAAAAAAGGGAGTTVVVPDIVNGLFLIKVHNE